MPQKFSKVAGRMAIHSPNNPGANNRGYVLYSRWFVEQHVGRYLTSDECVHHINGDHTDNRIENLEVLTRAEHTRKHWKDETLGKNVGNKRKLDYALLEKLMNQGLGYKRIHKKTGYPISSIKSACRIIRGRISGIDHLGKTKDASRG